MIPFRDLYGIEPLARGSAPGRVNLMGDHTDYNDGLVLPIVIPQRTTVEIAVGENETEAFSSALNLKVSFDAVGGMLPDFSRYLGGCLRILADRGISIPPLRMSVLSDVPVGVGLSSSAALEVATLRAINAGFDLGLSDLAIAEMAWLAETVHAGVNCGIMDQIACAIGDPGRMLFLDTRSLKYRLVDLPSEAEIVVIDSGVSRSLASSGYNMRRAECEKAANLLGLASLRDIDSVASIDLLPSPLDRRVRHVLSENARVVAAMQADPASFGRLMNESHASLRDDYDVSHPAVDNLVSALQNTPSVLGARLTGAGFGGACVAMTKPGARDLLEQTLDKLPGSRIVTTIST